MLSVLSVGKRLGGRAVLSDVTFACGAGEVVVITGANGSGKSTLLRIAVGLVEPDRGSVTVGGLPVTGASGRARALLGYLPDATDVLPELSVAELIALVQTFKQASDGTGAAIAALRTRVGADDVWRQRLATLSFGQRKRALLLAALIGAPPLLVLDEPTNGLDGGGHTLIRELVDERRRNGQATVVATNDPQLAVELGATRWQLAGGRLARVALPVVP
jgi:ABC-type multidrug transport system ATPase subunit